MKKAFVIICAAVLLANLGVAGAQPSCSIEVKRAINPGNFGEGYAVIVTPPDMKQGTFLNSFVTAVVTFSASPPWGTGALPQRWNVGGEVFNPDGSQIDIIGKYVVFQLFPEDPIRIDAEIKVQVQGTWQVIATCTYRRFVPVAFDVHPGSCPNPLDTGKRGVTPAAIVGMDRLDVRDIDLQSVRLEGVAPLRWVRQ